MCNYLSTNIKRVIKKILALFGIEIRKVSSTIWDGGYLNAKQVINQSEKQNLSVCEYVEKLLKTEGQSKSVIDYLSKFNLFQESNYSVVEIGAGSGCFTQKTLEFISQKIKAYEIYETNSDWARYLAQAYPVTLRVADGQSLTETPDQTIDFIHAHGVFVYTPFLITLRYLHEIVRVGSSRAIVMADFYTEDCMTEDTLNEWFSSKWLYPTIMPKGYLCDFFERHQFTLIDSFTRSNSVGFSRYFIFGYHP